jgi:O-antigen/teichoic acid export membrane protein
MRKLFFKNISIKQILIKNTIWLSLSQVVSRVAKFFLVALAARILHPEGYGTFIYVSSVLAVFFEFSDLGLSGMFIRDFNQSKESKKSIGTILFLKMGIIAFVSFICALYVKFAVAPSLKILFSILLIMMILDFIKNFLLLFPFANNRSEHNAWVIMIESLVTVAIGWHLLHTKTPLEGLAIAYLIGSAVAFVVTVFLVKKTALSNMSTSLNQVAPLIKRALPFLGTSLIGSLLISTDIVMIKWLIGAKELGFYASGLKIYKIIVEFGVLLAATSYPIIVTVFKNRDEITRLIKKISNIYLLLGVPIMCGGFLLSDDILTFVYSNQYMEASTSFKCFMLIIPIQLMLFFFNRVIQALNGEKANLVFASISGGTNIVLNILLIPKFGIIGAVIATGVAKVIDFSLTLKYVRKHLNISLINWRGFLKITIGVLVMTFVLISVESAHILLKIIVGFVAYIFVLILLKEYQVCSFLRECKEKVKKVTI